MRRSGSCYEPLGSVTRVETASHGSAGEGAGESRARGRIAPSLIGVCVLIFGLLAAGSGAFAVCPVVALVSDTSTSANASAPIANFRFERAVYLITASELAANGMRTGGITAIGWTYYAPPGTTASAPLRVYLQNTTDTTNNKSTSWVSAISGMTLVHNATTTLPNLSGSFDIAFAGGSAFTYTGGGLYVAFDWGQYSGLLSTTTVVYGNGFDLVGGFKGAQSNVSAPGTLTANDFRPETRLTPATGLNNDMSVDYLIGLGAYPRNLVGPQVVQAVVTNRGAAVQSGVSVTLNVTGADTFTNTQTISTLAACGGISTVTFASFTPSALGRDTMSVSVPPDQNNSNNSITRPMDVTVNQYSYKYPGTILDGGLGFGDTTGELATRFSPTSPTQVDSIAVEFAAPSATAYRLVIRGDDGTGKPGAELYSDSADRSVGAAGTFVMRLPSPVPVGPGNFFVAIRQTNTTNVDLSFNTESPIRSGTFYYSPTPATGPWTDFSPFNDFKLNVGVLLGPCLVPLGVDVAQDGTTHACLGGAIPYTATATGGTGSRTYQWTENGVDVSGATASGFAPSKGSSGTFTYNCKVTDDAGCINVVDVSASTGVWDPPATAIVSGGGTVCPGGSSIIQAGLTGAGPWNVTWSDGFIQSGVAASPAVRTVSPSTSTSYSVTALSDTCGAGTMSGSAPVTIDTPPGETAAGPDPGDWLLWSSPTQLVWPSNPNATSYTLYRGDSSTLASLLSHAVDSCTRYQGTVPSKAGLDEVPAIGDILWYLVTGTDAAGCEGSAGSGRTVDSSGSCP